jgi:hypothetical protein
VAADLHAFIRSPGLKKKGHVGVVAAGKPVKITVAAWNAGPSTVVTVKCKLPAHTKLLKPRRGRYLKGRSLTFKHVTVVPGDSDLVHFSYAYLQAGKGQAFVACKLIQHSPKRVTQAVPDPEVKYVNVVSRARAESPCRTHAFAPQARVGRGECSGCLSVTRHRMCC